MKNIKIIIIVNIILNYGNIIAKEVIDSIYAIEYGISKYPSSLVNSKSKEKKVEMSWLVYLLEEKSGERILIDTGFEEEAYARNFGLSYFQKPSKILKDNQIELDSINDIVVTHSHFDHIGGIKEYPKARIYISKKEYESLQKKQEWEKYSKFLLNTKAQGRLVLVEREFVIRGWLKIQETGGHTVGSQILRWELDGESYIATGDECYFSDACREKIYLPKGALYSFPNNKMFIDSIQNEKILTLHDRYYFKDYSGLHFRKIYSSRKE